MAAVLHFHPSVETLDAFNERLSAYCTDNDVVDVMLSPTGAGILVSTIEPDDTPAPMIFAIMPVIYAFTPEEAPKLEGTILGYWEAILAQNSEETPSLPIRAQTIMRTDVPGSGYIIILVCIGVLEEDPNGGQP